MKWPETSLIDSPVCCQQEATKKMLWRTIIWFWWRNDCWKEGYFVKLSHSQRMLSFFVVGAGFEAWWLSHMYTWSTCDWWLWYLSDEPSKSVQLSKSCVVVSFIPKRSPRDLNAYFSVTWKRITPVKLPDPPFPTVLFDSFLMPLSPLKAIPLPKREHVLYYHGSCSHIYGHICT